jgi:hypothetical protein
VSGREYPLTFLLYLFKSLSFGLLFFPSLFFCLRLGDIDQLAYSVENIGISLSKLFLFCFSASLIIQAQLSQKVGHGIRFEFIENKRMPQGFGCCSRVQCIQPADFFLLAGYGELEK